MSPFGELLKTFNGTFQPAGNATAAPPTFALTARGRYAALMTVAVLMAGCSMGTPESREAEHMARGKKFAAAKDYRKAAIDFRVASQNMPKDAEPLYQLGLTYLQGGAAKQAYETFGKAVAVDPKHEKSQYQWALFRVGSNKAQDVTEAKQFLLTYLKSHPDDTEAMASIAMAEAKFGSKEAAVEMVEAAVVKNPANMRPAAVMVALFAARGDTDMATKLAGDLVTKLPNSPDAAALKAEVSMAMHDNAEADIQIGRALSMKRDFRPALQLRLRRELMSGDRQKAENTTQELAKLPEKQTWSAYGRMLFAEGKIEPAKTEFNRVLREHGDDLDIRNQYSSLLITTGRQKEALEIISGTLAKAPKNVAALLQRVSLQIDKGDLDSASRDVKTLLGMKAVSAELSYQQGRIFAARGETLHQGDALIEALKYNPRFLQARLDLARLLLSSGKTKAAMEILEQGSAPEKNTAEYAYFRNMALMADGKWDEAKAGVEAALTHGNAPGFLYQDALLRSHNGDVPGMRKSLEAAFKAMPTDPATLNLLGSVMRAQGEQKQFTTMLREALTKNPGSALLQSTLGSQLAASGDASGARVAFEAAKAAGDVSNAEIALASVDIAAGNVDKALDRLLALVKTHDSASAELLLASIEGGRGAAAETVVQRYMKAVQLEPGNIPAMNNLAETLASRQNKFDDAAFWAQKALALAPTSPVVQDTLGWIYFRQGKYEAALPHLERSVKGMDRPVAHFHLAAALAKMGDQSRARREFDMGMKQDPKSGARAVAEALLAKN